MKEMNKILINASVLKQMLESQPEIEIELIKNAAAQIAEVLKKKINQEKSVIYDNAVTEINNRLNYKYHLPKQVLDVIGSAVDDQIKRFNDNQASKMAKEAFDKAVISYEKKLEARIDATITSMIEKKVAAVFATAAKLR